MRDGVFQKQSLVLVSRLFNTGSGLILLGF